MSDLWKIALTVADQQTGLSASAVANYDELLRVCRWLGYICGFGHAASGSTVVGHRCADCAVGGAGALVADWLATRRGW